MGEEHLTAGEPLERTDMTRSPRQRRSVTPASSKTGEGSGLATVRGGKVIPTARARGLVDALHVDRRGDGKCRATRLG